MSTASNSNRTTRTPGSWEVQTHLGNNDIHRVMPVFKRTNVGRLPPCEGNGFYIKNAADAHLIAAAPEMKEACKDALWLLGLIRVAQPDAWMAVLRLKTAGDKQPTDVWDALKAAIAKAEGR